MRKSIALRIALAPLVLGIATVGCSTTRTASMFQPKTTSAVEARADQNSAKSYELAQAWMQKGDLAQALTHAEQAVEGSPKDAGYRLLLGDLYMKNGRFRAAASAFSDTLVLHPGSDRARFNLALAQIAVGDKYSALMQLERLSSTAAPGDLGLAFALAGQTDRALAMLEPAARQTDADGRVRQNLALAYALAGDWQRARIVASQDLSPADLTARMEQWASFAQPQAAHDQIASLLGVKAVDDAGQPSRLALVVEASPTVQMAQVEAPQSAEPVEEPVYAEAEPAKVLEQVQAQAAPVYAQAMPAEPIGVRVTTPEAKVIRARIAAPVRVAARPVANGRYVVQLGAYDSARLAAGAWHNLQKRYGLSGHAPVTARVSFPKGVFHRLSAGGFATQTEAVRTCQSIKAKGGACFVRATSGDAPVRLASRIGRNG